MRFTRRRFLAGLALALGGAIGALLALRKLGLLRAVREAYRRRLDGPGLPTDTPTAALAPETLRVLLAATEAIIGETPGPHYAEFFRWRSTNVRGYHAVYERFRDVLDEVATRQRGSAFSGCDLPARRAILAQAISEPAAAARHRRTRLDELSVLWRPGWSRLLEHRVVREVLDLFRVTDAWLRLGYDGWPGQPRGLIAYRQPLSPPAPAGGRAAEGARG